MQIEIFEITGKAALSRQNGEKLYKLLESAIYKDAMIILDFHKVQIFATPFFNASLGRLAFEDSAEELLKVIKIKNITKNGEGILKTTLESSDEIKSSQEYQDKLAAIFEFQGGQEDDY